MICRHPPLSYSRWLRRSHELNPPPPGWGTDALTAFLDDARRNRFATFANKPEFKRLIKLDACFLRVVTDWLNPKDLLAPFLLMRSHSAFRAACEHAAAGQVVEVFPQIRLRWSMRATRFT